MLVFSGQLVVWTAQGHCNVLVAVHLIHLKSTLPKTMPWLFDVVSDIVCLMCV